MNIHHLELFYYVARHGGISEAVRHMPYGIQQPAVSAQIIQLEEFLGTTLFHRRPFALTEAGETLRAFVSPFFSNLETTTERLRGNAARQIRIGASEVIQRDHLPEMVLNVRRRFPRLKLQVREGYQPQLETWLQGQELDLAFTIVEGKPASGIRREELIQLPLALLVEASSRIVQAEDLWARDRIDEPLIALPAAEGICRHFQRELARRDLEWFPSLEVSSLGLVEAYVANGFGIGLSLDIPKGPQSPKLRRLPLRDFPPIHVGALWVGRRTPLMDAFIEEAHKRAAFLRS